MKILLTLVGLLALAVQTTAIAHIYPHSGDVTVEIVTDDGRVLPFYSLQHSAGHSFRAYLEAVRGKNYGIRIHNRTGRRVGLVIAVDGRNIISGRKSNLTSSEQMYILGPYKRGHFEGWRTSTDKVHRFYFTEAGDSYAGAWGDYSAMGVIAVAVYPEKTWYRPFSLEQKQMKPGRGRTAKAEEAAPAPAQSAGVLEDSSSRPGTGFGNELHSHARRVHFDPVTVASSRYFYKYEWHETLCNKGIIDCGHHSPNRFWPDDGEFAPFPPG